MIVYNIYSVARLETTAGGVTTGTDVSSTNMILASQHPSSSSSSKMRLPSLETFNKAI